MLLGSLHERLIRHIRELVRAGDLSERALARLTGLSQPHLHNVLKGVRALSTGYADRILTHLNLSVFDLLSPLELEQIAIEARTRTPARSPGATYPPTQSITEPITAPTFITLGHDPQLFPDFQAGDLALAVPLTGPKLEQDAVYLVRTATLTLVRYLRQGGTRLYLITPATRDEPRNWDFLPIQGSPQSAGIILGKLAWIGRRLTIR